MRVPEEGAFTLLELSIVLVVIGLIAGGIFAGRGLIGVSELKAVSAEYSKYQQAINAFQVQYQALPGDMTNATDFWGAADADPATCETIASTTTLTCNGDGDGIIEQGSEHYPAWKQLANARLIGSASKDFSDIAAEEGQIIADEVGVNIPKSKFRNAGWGLKNWSSAAPDALPGNASTLTFGATRTGQWNRNAVLSPEEAYRLDKKFDDGMPYTGKVVTFAHTVTTSCIVLDGVDALVSPYNIALTGPQCNLVFSLPTIKSYQ